MTNPLGAFLRSSSSGELFNIKQLSERRKSANLQPTPTLLPRSTTQWHPPVFTPFATFVPFTSGANFLRHDYRCMRNRRHLVQQSNRLRRLGAIPRWDGKTIFSNTCITSLRVIRGRVGAGCSTAQCRDAIDGKRDPMEGAAGLRDTYWYASQVCLQQGFTDSNTVAMAECRLEIEKLVEPSVER